MAQHDGELKNCIYNWAGGINPEPDPFSGPAGTGILGAAINQTMVTNWEAARKSINVEHCMIAKGWRLVRLVPEEGGKLARLPQKDLAAVLAPDISAGQPRGEIVRFWRNEEIYQSTVIARSPENAERYLLSAAAMSPDNPMIVGITSIDPVVRKRASEARSKLSAVLGRTKKLSDVTPPGPGQALFIYSIRTKKKQKSSITWLERADLEDPMSVNVLGRRLITL
ncbi:hypothetical protein [Asticcacaulis sp. W401b]|uniref:hypothetical protein n=1 Tax=Asticcacaulis sp. W401b TaxID=3388666 RepID=UPI0039709D2E